MKARVHNKKREENIKTCPCTPLNVCGESLTWNANYLATISKYVIVYKHHRAWGGTAIIGIPSAWFSTYIQHSVLERSILSSLFYCVLLVKAWGGKSHGIPPSSWNTDTVLERSILSSLFYCVLLVKAWGGKSQGTPPSSWNTDNEGNHTKSSLWSGIICMQKKFHVNLSTVNLRRGTGLACQTRPTYI